MKHSNFDLWKLQSIGDLKAYRKKLEGEKVEIIKPLDKTISEIDRMLLAMEGDSQPRLPLSAPKRVLRGGIEAEGKGTNFGYRYPPGTHWTQKPGNKARLRQNAIDRAAKRFGGK